MFRFLDLQALTSTLARAELWYLLVVVFLRSLIFFVRGWRFWHLTQITAGRALALGRVVGRHFVSLNLGTFTPAGLGEISMVYFLRREGVEVGQTAAAMILDKLITIGMVTFMSLVGATLYLGLDAGWWLLAGGTCAALALIFLACLRLSGRIRVAGKRWQDILEVLRTVFGFASEHPRGLLVNGLAAILQSLLFSAQIWVCLRMLGTAIEYAGVFWLSGLGRLVNMLPVTIGGVGVYEGAMVLLLEELGVAREVALSGVLLPRTLTWLVAAVVVCWVLWRRPTWVRPAAGS